jgi:hypothetical protein
VRLLSRDRFVATNPRTLTQVAPTSYQQDIHLLFIGGFAGEKIIRLRRPREVVNAMRSLFKRRIEQASSPTSMPAPK